MNRMEILRKAFKEGADKFSAVPEDEKPVAALVLIASAIVFVIAVVGLIALILNVLASFWWVLLVGVGVWYFWPHIFDIIRKRG